MVSRISLLNMYIRSSKSTATVFNVAARRQTRGKHCKAIDM